MIIKDLHGQVLQVYISWVYYTCTWHSAFHCNTPQKWDFIDTKDFRCTMSIWECKWCASGNFSGKSFFCTLWYCVWGFYSDSLQCTHALLLNRGIWVVLMFEDLSLSLTLWLGHKDTGMKLPAVVLRLFSCLDRLLPKVPGVLIPLKLQVTAPDLVVQPGTL